MDKLNWFIPLFDTSVDCPEINLLLAQALYSHTWQPNQPETIAQRLLASIVEDLVDTYNRVSMFQHNSKFIWDAFEQAIELVIKLNDGITPQYICKIINQLYKFAVQFDSTTTYPLERPDNLEIYRLTAIGRIHKLRSEALWLARIVKQDPYFPNAEFDMYKSSYPVFMSLRQCFETIKLNGLGTNDPKPVLTKLCDIGLRALRFVFYGS